MKKYKAKTLLLSAFIAGMVGTFCLSGCGKNITIPENNISATEEAKSSATPIKLLKGEAQIVTQTGENGEETQYVSQTVSAIISPATVADKYVTWQLEWAKDAPLKDSDITKYLKLTDDSQGKLTATIHCYKSFKGSKAVLTCTTRQGNKQVQASVEFVGVPSSMTIRSPSSATKYNLGKDTVDFLLVGKTYLMTLSLDNMFHDVGDYTGDCTAYVTGVGSVNCGVYSTSPRGAYWYADSNKIEFSTIAKEFVKVSVVNRQLMVEVTKSLYDYYESSKTEHVEMTGEVTTYTNKLRSLNTDADGNKPYFVVTVRHKLRDFSAQYKFFIGDDIEKLTLTDATVKF